MGNILTYVKKCGHLTFEEKPFNMADVLTLSELGYLHFRDLIPHIDDNKESVVFGSLLSDENILKVTCKTIDEVLSQVLLKKMRTSRRYKDLKVNYYHSTFDVENIEQFGAFAFEIEDFIFVIYRGTDVKLLGWYEDFNIIAMEEIPSQKRSLEYLNKLGKLTDKKLMLTGHSKGGNLAIYSAVYCEQEIKDRIIHVYDVDGPGFYHNIFESPEYKEIDSRVTVITPDEAIIGAIEYQKQEKIYVKSRAIFIFRHDLFNWRINRKGQIKFVDGPNFRSIVFKKSMDLYLETRGKTDRGRVIDMIFYLLMPTPEFSSVDLIIRTYKIARGIKKRYKAMSEDDKKFFKGEFGFFLKNYKKNFISELKKRMRFKRVK